LALICRLHYINNNMQRRSFLKLIAFSGLLPAMPAIGKAKSNGINMGDFRDTSVSPSESYLRKMRNPDNFYVGDVTAELQEQRMMTRLAYRLEQVKNVVGYGNFGIMSFDEMLQYGRGYSQIGSFKKVEIDFLEKLFYEDAHRYGFYGEKPLTNITDTIEHRSIVKVPYTGQFLFKGKPQQLYKKIKHDVGDKIILTSGIRSVVKQMHLFLRKASTHECNLSLTSRSLAPPGYSFHGIGDFDVGHIDLGAQNFTNALIETDEFKKLLDLGYVSMRYPLDNGLGVRFEPWHIKVL